MVRTGSKIVVDAETRPKRQLLGILDADAPGGVRTESPTGGFPIDKYHLAAAPDHAYTLLHHQLLLYGKKKIVDEQAEVDRLIGERDAVHALEITPHRLNV